MLIIQRAVLSLHILRTVGCYFYALFRDRLFRGSGLFALRLVRLIALCGRAARTRAFRLFGRASGCLAVRLFRISHFSSSLFIYAIIVWLMRRLIYILHTK